MTSAQAHAHGLYSHGGVPGSGRLLYLPYYASLSIHRHRDKQAGHVLICAAGASLLAPFSGALLDSLGYGQTLILTTLLSLGTAALQMVPVLHLQVRANLSHVALIACT
jgi:hypothetical protein